MSWLWFAVGTLAVFRVTHLLQAEDGPWEVVLRLRRRAGSGFFGSLLDCFYCLSLWVSAPAALVLVEGAKERLLLWPALSAGAILIERLTRREQAPAAAVHREDDDEEVDDEVLRTGSTSVPGEHDAEGDFGRGRAIEPGRHG
jgi:hypothetical protein